jgi:hypothetical protein
MKTGDEIVSEVRQFVCLLCGEVIEPSNGQCSAGCVQDPDVVGNRPRDTIGVRVFRRVDTLIRQEAY